MSDSSNNITEQDILDILQENQSKLMAIAYAITGNREEAEDIFSEVSIKAVTNRAQLEDPNKAIAWLSQITRNSSKDHLRRQNSRPKAKVNLDEIPQRILADLPEQERLDRISQIEMILDAMLDVEPQDYREVLIYFHYRKFSTAEIAVMTGVPQGTVKTRLAKARKLLKEELDKRKISMPDLEGVGDISDWPLLPS